MIYLATGLHAEMSLSDTIVPQHRSTPSGMKAARDKWCDILVFFTLARKAVAQHADIRLCLFTDVMPPPVIDGLDLAVYLPSLGVEVIPRAHYWRPARPLSATDNFYLFDMCEACLDFAADDDHIVIADSACLFVGRPDPICERLKQDGILLRTADMSSDGVAAMLSPPDEAALYGALGGIRQPLVAPGYDTAFFGLAVRDMGRFLDRAFDAFEVNDRRMQSGFSHFTRAAQFLVYIVVQLGRTNANADDLMRRIATSWAAYDTRMTDLDLAVWHLPDERNTGLPALAAQIARAIGTDTESKDARNAVRLDAAQLARHFGIGKMNRLAFAARCVRLYLGRITQLLSGLLR